MTNYNIKYKQHNNNHKVVASAPGKVILYGEHFVVYGTSAILCAIDKRVHITAIKSQDIQIQSELANLKHNSYKQNISQIDPILRPLYYIAKKSTEITGSNSGITLQVKSDIPSGAGLGSSSACCVAGAAAVLKLLESTNTQTDDIINMAINAERTVFPNASGADTAVSALGGMITYNTKTGYEKIKSHTVPKFGLVITNSKIPHNTKTVVSQVERFKNKNQIKFRELLNKETHLVSQVLSILNSKDSDRQLSKAAVVRLGKLASLNQEYLKAIKISNNALDKIIKIMESMTFGAKITGAGGGGCIIGFTDKKTANSKTQTGKTEKETSKAMSQIEIVKRISNMGHDCFEANIDNTGLNTF